MIQIKKLHFSYSKNRPVLKGINIEFEEGKIYGLLGKNGAGKTTLLNLLCGALFPSSGKILLDAFISSQRRVKFLNQLYYVPEDLEVPFVSIHSFAKLYGTLYPHFDNIKFDRIISGFGLSKDHKMGALSYGQKRIAAIAFGLSANVKYLLLDEPTNGLDIPSKNKLRKVITKETRDDQVVIISTHQIRDLSQILESVVIIDGGEVLLANDLDVFEKEFFFERSPVEDPSSIWSEMSAGSYINIYSNPDGLTSEIDLEVLFNAVTSRSLTSINNNKKTVNGI